MRQQTVNRHQLSISSTTTLRLSVGGQSCHSHNREVICSDSKSRQFIFCFKITI